jgi:hypothetical protein
VSGTPVWPKEVQTLAPKNAITDPRDTEIPELIPVFDESQTGTREVLQPFTIQRENVTGGKDLTIKTIVYGWQQFTQVKWENDGYGKYMDQFAPKGEKYVFVYLAEYVEGDVPEKDSRAWYFGPHLFRLQVDGRLYDQDSDFVPAIRIKELEVVLGYNGIKGLRPFGYQIVQARGSGNITAIEDPWLHMGRSNVKDGYLVYRVPLESDPATMMLVGAFGSWGQAAWRLA